MNKWQLVFEEKFDSDELNPQRWNINEGGGGFGNQELQYYHPANVKIENSQLVITGEKGCLTIGNIVRENHNQGKFSFQYGLVEIRAKLPKGKGMWPALWMMPENSRYGPWPSCGEIDIMESLGHNPAYFYGTIHFGKPHTEAGVRYIIPGFDSEKYYTYKLLWDKKEIRWYVDDFLIGGVSRWFTSSGEYPRPFDQPFYLIVNLAIGGRFPGNPDETTVFPQHFVVDYIRVYQRNGGD